MLGIDYVSSDEEDEVSVAKPEVSHGIMWREDAIATDIELSNIPSPIIAPAPTPAPAAAPLPSEKVSAPTALPKGPPQGRKLDSSACRRRNTL